MSNMLPKVKFLRELYPLLDIEVDGGVGVSNVQQCACNGANMIVAGTAIINSSNRKETIHMMKKAVEEAISNKQ
jgi:ribulose-phosphate 3-epimerase